MQGYNGKLPMRDLTRMLVAASLYASDPLSDTAMVFNDTDYVDPGDPITRDEFEYWVLWTAQDQLETAVVDQLSHLIGPTHSISAKPARKGLSLVMGDTNIAVPLWPTSNSIICLVSSLAYLLRYTHDFWAIPHLSTADLHPFLVTTKQETKEMMLAAPDTLTQIFEPFQPGRDPFTGIDVPFLDHETRNPEFAQHYRAIAPQLDQIRILESEHGAQLTAIEIESAKRRAAISKDYLDGRIGLHTISCAGQEIAEMQVQSRKITAQRTAELRQEIFSVLQELK